jgi:hypothetical protein
MLCLPPFTAGKNHGFPPLVSLLGNRLSGTRSRNIPLLLGAPIGFRRQVTDYALALKAWTVDILAFHAPFVDPDMAADALIVQGLFVLCPHGRRTAPQQNKTAEKQGGNGEGSSDVAKHCSPSRDAKKYRQTRLF